ncbi:MAG: hypothetical protein IJW03_04830 [Clostridia bacterium]|nr:hypothetical protein [Clostridia bacterium]
MESKVLDEKNVHSGHRQRMRAKLVEHGQRIFDTYELLEMLLYYVIPYKDTNPISKRLLETFGSLDGVLLASAEELATVSGIGERAARFLSLVGALSDIIGGEMLPEEYKAFDSYSRIGEYLTELFENESESCVYVMLLDNGLNLIATEKLYSGYDYESSAVKSDAFVTAASKYKAAFAVTAHNHIHGPCYPTQGDRATDMLVSQALQLAGVRHLEHFIVTGERYIGISRTVISGMSHPLPIEFYGEIEESKYVSATPFSSSRCEREELFREILSFAARDGGEALAADRLFARHHTIENILNTDLYALEAEVGASRALQIKLCACICSRRKTDKFAFGVEHCDIDIAEYFKALYIGVPVETVYAVFFDRRGRAIKCECIGEGTVNASEILPKKILHSAVRTDAAAVALAHNHPFGVCEPSDEDISFTALLSEALSCARIKLRLHAVVAGQTAEFIDAMLGA